MAPESSPEGHVQKIRRPWTEIQGSRKWARMLPPEDPLDEELKDALVRYGEFAQATYDAYDWHIYSSKRTAGTCKYSRDELLEKVGLAHTGYRVTHYVYSTTTKFRWPGARVMPPLPEEEGEEEDLLPMAAYAAPKTGSQMQRAFELARRGFHPIGSALWRILRLWFRVCFAPLLIFFAVVNWVLAQEVVQLFLAAFVPCLNAVLVPLLDLLNRAIELLADTVLQDRLMKYTSWIGFVAESGDEASERLGRRDIVVAWRGTMSPAEWLSDFTDLQSRLPSDVSGPLLGAAAYHRSAVPTKQPLRSSEGVKVHLGFWNIYNGSDKKNRVPSARRHVIRAVVDRLHREFDRGDREVAVSVTGHSLGGALATLCGYDLARALHKRYPDRQVPVTVFNFAAPRVGNSRFKESFDDTPALRQLRVVNRFDTVPQVPGVIFNEREQEHILVAWLRDLIDQLPWTYSHVGELLEIDTTSGPDSEVFGRHTQANYHCLEAYLHMLDGKRDFALVNKWSNYLDDNKGLPWFWWQEKNKCVARDPSTKRLRQPRRDWDETARIINRLPRL